MSRSNALLLGLSLLGFAGINSLLTTSVSAVGSTSRGGLSVVREMAEFVALNPPRAARKAKPDRAPAAVAPAVSDLLPDQPPLKDIRRDIEEFIRTSADPASVTALVDQIALDPERVKAVIKDLLSDHSRRELGIEAMAIWISHVPDNEIRELLASQASTIKPREGEEPSRVYEHAMRALGGQ